MPDRTTSGRRAPAGTGDPGRHHALVLSGGGAKGAYEVGVMKALFEGASAATGHRPLAAGIYSGTSVGSYNAAYMATYGDHRWSLEVACGLERVWRQRIASRPSSCGNGVFRIRGSPLTFLEPGCWRDPFSEMLRLTRDTAFFARLLAAEVTRFATSRLSFQARLLRILDLAAFFDMEPLDRLLTDTVDLRRLRASPIELAVVASDFLRGTPRAFWKHELCDTFGTAPVAASAAIPGLFPATVIDGVPFVDGGATMNTPLSPAMIAGAQVLHVVFLEPDVAGLRLSHTGSTLDTVYRLTTIEMASNIHNNILQIPSIFQELKRLRQLFADGEHDQVRAGLQQISQMDTPKDLRLPEDWPFREIEIHKYFPNGDLGGAEGLIDFRLETVDRNIAQGYRDAVEHDCKTAGCIVQPSERGEKVRQ